MKGFRDSKLRPGNPQICLVQFIAMDTEYDQHTAITAILKKVRPFIQGHGGDVTLISAKEGLATLRVEGACVHCPLAKLTYNTMIQRLILEDVPGIHSVVFE